MDYSDLEAIGLSPDVMFRFIAENRPINFEFFEKNALSTNLAETAFVSNWMTENGYGEQYASYPQNNTRLLLQIGRGGGILADIMRADRENPAVAEAYEIYKSAALTTGDDVIGQLAFSPVLNFSTTIENLDELISEAYPNYSEGSRLALIRTVLLDQMLTTQTSPDNLISALEGRIEEITGNDQCFAAGTMIDMWPTDPSVKLGPNGLYNKAEVLSKVWEKPIEDITPDDWVLAFDKNENLVPGKVTRTFRNEAKIILDFHGTLVTPGHVYYRPDSKKPSKFEPLIDILRDDGIIQHKDGSLIRAATGCAVDSEDDQEFWAFLIYEDDPDRVDRRRNRMGFGISMVVNC